MKKTTTEAETPDNLYSYPRKEGEEKKKKGRSSQLLIKQSSSEICWPLLIRLPHDAHATEEKKKKKGSKKEKKGKNSTVPTFYRLYFEIFLFKVELDD